MIAVVYFAAAAFGSFCLGVLLGQFIRLPGLTAVCDNAGPFSAICIMVAVWMCCWSQITLYRSTRELRLLGAELRRDVVPERYEVQGHPNESAQFPV